MSLSDFRITRNTWRNCLTILIMNSQGLDDSQTHPERNLNSYLPTYDDPRQRPTISLSYGWHVIWKAIVMIYRKKVAGFSLQFSPPFSQPFSPSSSSSRVKGKNNCGNMLWSRLSLDVYALEGNIDLYTSDADSCIQEKKVIALCTFPSLLNISMIATILEQKQTNLLEKMTEEGTINDQLSWKVVRGLHINLCCFQKLKVNEDGVADVVRDSFFIYSG